MPPIPDMPHKILKGPIAELEEIDSKFAAASEELERATRAAQDAEQLDVAAVEEAEDQGRPAPEPRSEKAESAEKAARIARKALEGRKRRAEANIQAAREMHKGELVAKEREAMKKLDAEQEGHLDRAAAIEPQREMIAAKMVWLNEGRVKGSRARYVPLVRGEGGEDRVRAETMIDAVRPRNQEARRASGPPPTRATEGASPGRAVGVGQRLKFPDGTPYPPPKGSPLLEAVAEGPEPPPLWEIAGSS